MDIEGEFKIAASRPEVWIALNDPEVLRRCIPGCESLEAVDESTFKGRIRTAIGPVKAAFDTDISIDNPNPPEGYTLTGEARAGAAGFGKGTAEVQLTEENQRTRMHYRAHFTVGGKLARVGSRLVLGATRKLADEFFGNLSRALDAGAVKVSAVDDTPLEARARQGSARARIAVAIAAVIVVFLIYRYLVG